MTETGKKRRIGGREATEAIIPGDYAISVGNPQTPLPAGWQWRLLTDLARLESGHTPSRKRDDYWGGDIPWIGIRDATANHGRTIYGTNENTNELGIANSAARVLPKETVCLSRTASVGYVIVMGRPMATSQDFVNWICGPDLDYRYLKYALIAEGAALLRFADGSVHQTIYFPEVKALHIALPERREQEGIATVLSTLDDKIELNRRMNETLEALAQVIFKDWFVTFGPTRRKMEGATDPVAILGGLIPDPTKAAPLADLFPDNFGEDGLPEGWEETTLDAVCTVNDESWKASNHPDEVNYVDLSNTKWGVIESTSILAWKDAPSRARRIARPGDTIVGTVRPGNGSYAFISDEGYTASTGFAVLRPSRPEYASFVYIASTRPENIERVANLADSHGGAYPAVNPGEVTSTKIAFSGNPVMLAFDKLAGPFRERIEHNKNENRTLSETRDYLLPKLMSGAVRVRDAAAMVEGAD